MAQRGMRGRGSATVAFAVAIGLSITPLARAVVSPSAAAVGDAVEGQDRKAVDLIVIAGMITEGAF